MIAGRAVHCAGDQRLNTLMPQPSFNRTATITALNVYPVKSCAGTAVPRARLTPTGFEHDRQWMIVRPNGRFVTQRERPRLALIRPEVGMTTLQLSAPGLEPLHLSIEHDGATAEVEVWNDRCTALDAGAEAAQWLEQFLGEPLRLVRFHPSGKRTSDTAWTGGIEALNQFSDGFPWLLISQESLDALNAKLSRPLPMNRFRPNIVVAGLQPFEEDALESLGNDRVALRPVKPCTRCAITTTSQETGEREGDEPLRTLRSFRFDAHLRGVTFGQNIVLQRGLDEWLAVGETLHLKHREP
jgi:uncharacterized protein